MHLLGAPPWRVLARIVYASSHATRTPFHPHQPLFLRVTPQFPPCLPSRSAFLSVSTFVFVPPSTRDVYRSLSSNVASRAALLLFLALPKGSPVQPVRLPFCSPPLICGFHLPPTVIRPTLFVSPSVSLLPYTLSRPSDPPPHVPFRTFALGQNPTLP